MALLRRVIPSLVSISTNPTRITHVHRPQSTVGEAKSNSNINMVCESLRRGLNWDALNKRFGSLEFTESFVSRVLLELKKPVDAKWALGFFHWSAQCKNFEHGEASYCITIHILVGAHLLMDARSLLESTLKKNAMSRFLVVDSLLSSYKVTGSNPHVFDLLVQTYSKLRMFEIGFDVCCYLEEHGFSLSLISFNTLLHFVQKSDNYPLVWKIYEHMIRVRKYPNEVSVNVMISALCKEGALQKFVDMLDRIHEKRCSPVVIVNTCMIFRMLEEGRLEQGMLILKRLLQKNMILDTISYSLIAYAKVKYGTLDSAWEVYEEMLNRGFHPNAFVYTLFIGAHCTGGRIEEANKLMQDMENAGLMPYDETFNLLIAGCSKAGRLEEGLRFCERMMERGLVPSCLAFNLMMAGNLCESGVVKRANKMLTLLIDKGFVPDEITYSNLIASYGKLGEIQQVLKLYYEMEYRSLSPGLLVFESLIRGLCQCGELEQAEKCLRIMKDRSITISACVYETLINSYFEKGDESRASQLYNEMVSTGMKPSCACVFHP